MGQLARPEDIDCLVAFTLLFPRWLFEVRGETRPVRHRLTFPSREHMPIAPIEFRVGTNDLVVPVALGNRLAARGAGGDHPPSRRGADS